MPTVAANGLSVVHVGSGGTATAGVPDVCKTPTPVGTIPIPYPAVAQSALLTKGSVTVTADGFSMAVKDSEIPITNGDEAGVAGGVKSGCNLGKATWLTYSFNVMVEGKNVCRQGDMMLLNDGNTICFGVLQAPAI